MKILLMISTLVTFAFCPAGFSDAMNIRSHYIDAGEEITGKIIWNFKKAEGNAFHVFTSDDKQVAVLQYDGHGALFKIEKRSLRGGTGSTNTETRLNAIVLSDGFPVPYDYLIPFDDQPDQVTIKKQAGGLVFSNTYDRRIEILDFSLALSNGFLSPKMAEAYTGSTFRMITITKAEALIVRQLWPVNGNWWVFEETPVRKSWRQD